MPMKESKRKRLEAAGWTAGSTEEFLGLSAVESVLVDLRLALSRALKERRARFHISQMTLAGRIKSSQSRVAKMEAADPEVSFELLLRGLLALGATRRDVARALAPPKRSKKPRTTSRRHDRIGIEAEFVAKPHRARQRPRALRSSTNSAARAAT